MTLRQPASEAVYQFAKKNNPKHLTEEELVQDFKYWVVVKNRFPWDRIINKIHHMFVLKRDVDVHEITCEELNELWFEILPWANDQYDAVTVNMQSMRSVGHTPHIHAYTYLPELR